MKRKAIFRVLLAGAAASLLTLGVVNWITAAPSSSMGGGTATTSGWTQRNAGGLFNMVFRDVTYHPLSTGSVWDTAPLVALEDPGMADNLFNDMADFVGDVTAWTITETQATATQANGTTRPTYLLITNTAVDDDLVQIQLIGEGFQPTSTKPIWFETRVQVSEATQSDLYIGLIITDTSIQAGVTDGIYFRKDDGDANWDFVTEQNATPTATDTTSDLVAETWTKLGFWWDGTTARPYIDGLAVTGSSTTNVPTDENLTVSFAIQNGDGTARLLLVDYIKVVQIR